MYCKIFPFRSRIFTDSILSIPFIVNEFTVGFGEGRSNPQTPIQILPQALDETEKFLAEHTTETEQYNARLERVKKLIIGFESPLGLELLATIHWLVKHEDISPKNPDEIISKVQLTQIEICFQSVNSVWKLSYISAKSRNSLFRIVL